MDINSVSQLTNIAKQANSTEQAQLDPSLGEQFSQFMQLGTTDIQQAASLTTASNAAITPTNKLDAATDVTAVASPEVMLGGQELMTKATVEVGLAAKVAGSVAQSINKLVSLQ